MQTVQICLSTQQTQVKYLAQVHHTLSELTNILYLLALVILTHTLFLLLLAQLQRLVTTAHEQIAMEVGAG